MEYVTCVYYVIQVTPNESSVEDLRLQGTQFKASVNALMKNLLSKSPNYIRCVKVSTLGPVHNESSSNKHLVAKIKIIDSNVKNFEVPLQQAPAHNEPNIFA